MFEAAWRLAQDRRTYLRIVYLLLAFPLGTLYFVVIITGLSVGAGLAIVVVGFPILVATLLAWLLFGRIERELAVHLLGAQIRPMSIPDSVRRSARQRLLNTLGDPVTWRSLVYVLFEFPFGVFSFTLAVVLITVSLSLILYPVEYAVANILYQQLLPGQLTGTMWPGVTINGHFDPNVAAGFLFVSAFGVVLGIASLALLNGTAWLWARFAELMLGVDESRMQLAAAQAEATTQHMRAERADQSRRELIVNASHELRTPVASISAHVESLLKPGREMDAETRKYLSVVAAETDRLGSLVDDVLALARADADELRLDIQPVDVPVMIARVCETLAPLARRERNLSLVHSTATGLPRAMADRDRLAQVLTNLVRNAVNNTLDGGIISVEAAMAGDRVAITVSDTGIGMETADLNRIFDRFYRTDQSRARDTGGSGLGLAIVRDLVSAMGGSIGAESVPGRGSVFHVWLAREAA
ncbi:MAG TPA: sensor domain-containing protein [Candidatus Dormibacteraeota bacterium]|nr:sensor domain-containing protein [Candidatus Dormibacteraeota bacterium]